MAGGRRDFLMENNALQIRSLSVKTESGGQGLLEAVVENTGAEPVEDSVLLVYFYDSEGRVRDRISARIKSLPPSARSDIAAHFRLKNRFFFTYTASLHKAER